MDRPRENDARMPRLDDIPFMLIGAYAAASYAPERSTQDIDIIVEPEHVEEILNSEGWNKSELLFPNSNLGLFGFAFQKDGYEDIDLISSKANWLRDAFDAPKVINAFGKRVMPLPYLVLMKVESARGVDQGDLTRMLGRLEPSQVEEIVAVIEQSYSTQLSDDIRQYAEIGRWEYESNHNNRGGGR
jgi:hypothetical protein